MSDEPLSNGKRDVITHRILVCSLGGCVLLSALAIAVLAVLGQEVPPSLPAIGGTALGALTGMLASIMRNP
ncbi:MAG: hypothetical protein IT429_22245 [Gemmataceae bacterium]|nr:hypothetical protein [Gemmataceae bacterium]